MFHTMEYLTLPENFREVHRTFDVTAESSTLSARNPRIPELHILLASPHSPEQLMAVMAWLAVLSKDEAEDASQAVQILFMAHSSAPETRKSSLAERAHLTQEMAALGVDGIIFEEPEGFSLALEIRSIILRLAQQDSTFKRRVQQIRHLRKMEQGIKTFVWERLAPHAQFQMSAAGSSFEANGAPRIPGYGLGRPIGTGSCGDVLLLHPRKPRPGQTATEVLKVINKRRCLQLDSVTKMARYIEVMQLLACEGNRHPNIVQFYEVYHSPNFISLRMEFAGMMNLFQHLQGGGGDRSLCPLGPREVFTCMTQMLDALTHLHNVVEVCHRDIKPENVIADNGTGDWVFKLADFDTSVRIRGGISKCSNKCGTLPFVAPEVVLGKHTYCAKAADVWSTGMVFFELFLGARSIQRFLSVEVPTVSLQSKEAENLVKAIAAAFHDVNNLSQALVRQCRQCVVPVLKHARPVLLGMLEVDPDARMDSTELSSHLVELNPYA